MNKGRISVDNFQVSQANWEINQISSEILIFYSDLFSQSEKRMFGFPEKECKKKDVPLEYTLLSWSLENNLPLDGIISSCRYSFCSCQPAFQGR